MLNPKETIFNKRRRGILFFGTPNLPIQPRHWLERIASSLSCRKKKETLRDLSLPLQVRQSFRHQLERYIFFSFYSRTDQVRHYFNHIFRVSRLWAADINLFRSCRAIQR